MQNHLRWLYKWYCKIEGIEYPVSKFKYMQKSNKLDLF